MRGFSGWTVILFVVVWRTNAFSPLVTTKRTSFSFKPSSIVLSAENDDTDSGVVNKYSRCVCTCFA